MVALFGDRSPFATSGRPMVGPTGYRVVLVNIDARKVDDFIHNTRELPGSRLASDPKKAGEALERPIDVKFGPDGAMYVLDFGQMEMKGGRMRVTPGTGRIFRMVGADLEPATTQPPAAPGPQ